MTHPSFENRIRELSDDALYAMAQSNFAEFEMMMTSINAMQRRKGVFPNNIFRDDTIFSYFFFRNKRALTKKHPFFSKRVGQLFVVSLVG